MSEPIQFETITIPSYLNEAQRDKLGREIVRFIISRTSKGLDKYNRPFRRYTDSYKNTLDFKLAGKSGKVNLELTGEMLNTLEVISHAPGVIRIGYTGGSSNDKASFNRQNGREFIGITPKDLDLLITTTVPQDDNRLSTDIAEGFAAGFLRSLFGGE